MVLWQIVLLVWAGAIPAAVVVVRGLAMKHWPRFPLSQTGDGRGAQILAYTARTTRIRPEVATRVEHRLTDRA